MLSTRTYTFRIVAKALDSLGFEYKETIHPFCGNSFHKDGCIVDLHTRRATLPPVKVVFTSSSGSSAYSDPDEMKNNPDGTKNNPDETKRYTLSVQTAPGVSGDALCETALKLNGEIVYDGEVGYDDVRRHYSEEKFKEHMIKLVKKLGI